MILANDFLYIYYKEQNIVINRSQFSGSISLIGEKKLANKYSYFVSSVTYNEKNIIVFDLDNYFSDNYRTESVNDTKLAIISRIDILEKSAIDKLYRDCFTYNSNLATDYIAFSLTSNSEIKNSPVMKFRLLSQTLNSHLRSKGLLATSFIESRIEYFIDLNHLLSYNLLNEVIV